MKKISQVVTSIGLLFSSLGSAYAIGEKYYVQLGSCYLQKCVKDKTERAKKYQWPVTVHRTAVTKEGYHVKSAMWYTDVDIDVFMAEIEQSGLASYEMEMLAQDGGFLLSLGYFEDVVKAFEAKSLAEKILIEDGVKFAMKRLQNREESSKILVGPYHTEKKAKAMKKEIRATDDFPNAFMISKE
ncbi:hypothetical protein HR060_04865 [Catenovulum sp. SM1970]|uniref:hypothetical protein n=1 Tax=Marinifaba aquimaris TaxID=2741323 RepID=UPI001573111B|nr:hypothetical protein [Marinifaba aquimaris]NTS76193.1 hypothetical protein [Marinifaba aquimaris]